MLKLPLCLFTDYHEDGSLHLLLKLIFEFEMKYESMGVGVGMGMGMISSIKSELSKTGDSAGEEKVKLFIDLVKEMETKLIEVS